MNYSLTPSNDFQLNSLSENDYSDATLKYINDILMEDEHEHEHEHDNEQEFKNTPSILHDVLALQATERSFYDALTNNSDETKHRHSGRIKNRLGSEDEDSSTEEEQRSHKQLAWSVDHEPEPLEMYDNVLLSSSTTTSTHQSETGRLATKRGVAFRKEFVDLRSLLMKCAQAVANLGTATAIHLLLKIRRQSSPQGASLERVAHYFANALEARMAGTKSCAEMFNLDRISTAEILESYKTSTTACPFYKMSFLLANKAIEKLADGATALHIIDFGIMYGFQWPSLIQALSQRRGGPPRLRITGIEFPQKGPRPAQRVEDTGRRLAKYCERFGVPFEYNAVAQKWETIRLEDLKIEKDELLVVNSMYRHHILLDETMIANSIRPRDAVLNLIKNIDPAMFVQGIANGHYNVPFFTTRFQEAFFHFCNRLDMFESTMPREKQGKLLSEEQIFGSEAMNIIACEGTQRTEGPETYKKWQLRMRKFGFRQLPLDQEVVKYVRSQTEKEYHKSFSVDEDGKWMLQGWKGRVSHAMCCWQPARSWSSSMCSLLSEEL